MNYKISDTIVAISTPPGSGAIGVVRLSGDKAIEIADKIFFGKNLIKAKANQNFYGKIKSSEDQILDECMASIFRSPRSYTKEDVVEFACHGSDYILSSLLKLTLSLGARLAEPGEFTLRAYLNGQLDLAQSEAVADLIASKSEAQHKLAMNQLRGGVSNTISEMRNRLIEFASLIELENDFGEEDVEFANRDQLINQVNQMLVELKVLSKSFDLGNAIKDGIPVAIVGKPNAGKSTLLNALLKDDKAIVSPIAGTTRDVVEDTISINGKLYRFLDTAGLRETTDQIENIGILKAKEKIEKSSIVLFLSELRDDHLSIDKEFKDLHLAKDKKAIILLTKSDLFDHSCHAYDIEEAISTLNNRIPVLNISVEKNQNLDKLVELLDTSVNELSTGHNEVIISSARHYQSLENTIDALNKVLMGLSSSIPSDIIALDIRHALNSLGEISGEIQTDDLLDSIFSNFCIGK